jgi:hypothetical protein
MAIEFASGTSSVGPSPSVIAGLTEAVLQCSRLREATVLTELAARMLNEAMERLEERDALPLNSHPDRSRHAMAEALGLWRAAWTLCSTHLADRSGMLGVLQTIDQAGASLAGGKPEAFRAWPSPPVPCAALGTDCARSWIALPRLWSA